MRAAIYARVSRDARGQARSVEEQEAECRAWVQREDWQLLEPAFVDNDVSASKYTRKARPQWQALTAALEAGRVDVLVVWEPSRATRDRRVWAALAAVCEDVGVKLGVNGRLYDLGDPDDAFQLDLFFALATRESGTTRKRVQRSVRANAAAGRPHGKLLYGYRREYAESPSGPVLLAQVPDEDKAPVVREIARRVAAGEALYGIAADLNARGVPAPRTRAWEGTTVRRIATNPAYVAKRVHRGQVVGDATWPALVDDTTHAVCVQRMSDPARRTNAGRGVRHLLSGIAECGRCGGPMYVLLNRGTRSYTCRREQHLSRKEDDVDEVVVGAVVGRLARPDLQDVLAGPAPAEVEDARAEVVEKRARLEGFYDAAARGELTPAALTRIEARLVPEIAAAESRARVALPSPLLAEVAGPKAEETWMRLTLEQRRELVALLCHVRILPMGRGRRTFDPASVEVTWRTS
jgi:site-specific DNA recombinase